MFESTKTQLLDAADGYCCVIQFPNNKDGQAGERFGVVQQFEFQSLLQRMSVIAVRKRVSA